MACVVVVELHMVGAVEARGLNPWPFCSHGFCLWAHVDSVCVSFWRYEGFDRASGGGLGVTTTLGGGGHGQWYRP